MTISAVAQIDTLAPPRRYAEVIGDPIAHSKSPLIHNRWLRMLGIDAEYRACHVGPAELGAYIAARSADPLWMGCNVTIPHKLAILDYVDAPADVRDRIGAANTVYRAAGGSALAATNTDAGGFFGPIADVPLAGAHIVVIGGGGAARAVLFALAQSGVGEVTILNRNVLKAGLLLSTFGLKGRAQPLDAKLPADAALIVNASALGMTGQPPLDLDLGAVDADCIAYDLVYAPLMTDFLAEADARGMPVIGGLEMLIGQAAIAFELFFGSPPPDGDDAALIAALTG